MEISNIVKNLLMRYPLFGNIIANLEFKFTDDNFPAAAYTDGKRVYYRQEFFDDFDDQEREFIIAHEIFHIVLQHCFRNIGKDSDLLNFVEDGIINQLLSRDGLPMPEGCVNIPDALSYSTEELYMKYLSQLEHIKSWMQSNTYHVELANLDEWIKEAYNKDLQDLMTENSTLRSDIIADYKEKLKQQVEYGMMSLGIEFPSIPVGTTVPFFSWKELLRASISTSSSRRPSIYEVEQDGIIKKEYKPDISYCESEIIIDTSASMSMDIIKVILRECKNILKTGKIRVGFCDTEFYGWHDINNDTDIDNLQIKGRGGTSFTIMAKSFSPNVDNKIVITDGECFFSDDCSDVLWVILNWSLPYSLEYNSAKDKINYIFVDERELIKSQRLTLNK